MEPVTLAVVCTLALALLGMAGFTVYSQQQALANLRTDTEMSMEDRRYLYRRIVRRWFIAALLVVLVAFLVGWIFVEPNLDAMHPDEPEAKLTDREKDTLRLTTLYVIGGLLALMLVLLLACYDMLATARYGNRHRRQLADARREALHEEVDRILRDRHGLNGERRH